MRKKTRLKLKETRLRNELESTHVVVWHKTKKERYKDKEGGYTYDYMPEVSEKIFRS